MQVIGVSFAADTNLAGHDHFGILVHDGPYRPDRTDRRTMMGLCRRLRCRLGAVTGLSQSSFRMLTATPTPTEWLCRRLSAILAHRVTPRADGLTARLSCTPVPYEC